MKKLVLLFFLLCLSINNIIAQEIIINTFLQKGEHEDQYVLPDAIVHECCYPDSATHFLKMHTNGYFQLHRESPYSDGWSMSFACKTDDIAQLFHTDTLLTICGISVVLEPTVCRYFPDSFKYLFGIGDTTFNIKRSGVIPENTQDIYWGKSYYAFLDIVFDSSINVFGDYSVVFDAPKPSQYAEYDNDFNMSQIMMGYNVSWSIYHNLSFFLSKIYGPLKNTDCTHNKSFHKSALFKYDKQTDITTISDTCGWTEVTDDYPDRFYGFYIFPIFAETDSSLECIGCEGMTDTTDSSSLVNIVDNYTFIFPNPANKEVNVQCSFRMQTLELFNEQGQKVNEWKVDSYHYLLNVEDYPKGNYVMKIKTKLGTATKKVIIQ
jgi:hypothetical protein